MGSAFLYFLLCLSILSLAEGSCQINLSDDKISRPKIYRHFGSRKYPMSYDNSNIIIFKNEDFDAYCGTEFMSNYNSDSKSYKALTCLDSGQISDQPHYNYNNDNTLSCEPPTLQLFESLSTFDWCNRTELFGSFSLVVNNNEMKPQLAQICFSYEHKTPKIVKYLTIPTKYVDHNNLSIYDNLQDIDVSENEVFYENQIRRGKVELTISSKYFPEKESFEYYNLVQNGILFEMEGENPIVSVIWWHNLRVSNWKRYLDALNEQAEKSFYKIYAGFGGRMKAPESNLSYKSIPEYIWNVVQEINGTEEFVIMGYNSPYFEALEIFEEDKTIVCEDICETISWLDKIRHFFKYVHFGRMFCCSLEDALATGILEGMT